jgi:hypothetical protein
MVIIFNQDLSAKVGSLSILVSNLIRKTKCDQNHIFDIYEFGHTKKLELSVNFCSSNLPSLKFTIKFRLVGSVLHFRVLLPRLARKTLPRTNTLAYCV